MPQIPWRQPERSFTDGDVFPEEPWSSDDEGEENLLPAVKAAAAVPTSPVVARGLPGSRVASHAAATRVPGSPDSDQISESVCNAPPRAKLDKP